ncbi:hypothetical protein LSAT2_002797 [Lamellibrachia satsuma]|nr:hypothetical protein LSAT2_002797 [Lamellibrachia satsuma]
MSPDSGQRSAIDRRPQARVRQIVYHRLCRPGRDTTSLLRTRSSPASLVCPAGVVARSPRSTSAPQAVVACSPHLRTASAKADQCDF